MSEKPVIKPYLGKETRKQIIQGAISDSLPIISRLQALEAEFETLKTAPTKNTARLFEISKELDELSQQFEKVEEENLPLLEQVIEQNLALKAEPRNK